MLILKWFKLFKMNTSITVDSKWVSRGKMVASSAAQEQEGERFLERLGGMEVSRKRNYAVSRDCECVTYYCSVITYQSGYRNVNNKLEIS